VGYRTFLVDGFIAGFWRLKRDGGAATLSLEPLGKLAKPDRDALVAEGEELAAFLEPGVSTNTRFLKPA
jgi:hypothetical protein